MRRIPAFAITALTFGLAHRLGRSATGTRTLALAMLAGIGAAFLGFHAAMLSNLFTGVILFPFCISLVVAGLASFALRVAAR